MDLLTEQLEGAFCGIFAVTHSTFGNGSPKKESYLRRLQLTLLDK